MAAHADDLRYWYAEDLGETIEVAAPAAASTPLRNEKLEPGRYMLRILDFGGATAVWVRMGPAGNVDAAPNAPSTRFNAHTDAAELNKPLLTFMIRPRPTTTGPDPAARDMIAVYVVGGTGATIQVTKLSRGLS